MQQQVDQIVQAILVASDPSQATIHHQALEYLSSIQKNANETWQLGLALFVDVNADGSRKHPPQARFFGLRVLDDFLDSKFEPLDPNTFQTLQQASNSSRPLALWIQALLYSFSPQVNFWQAKRV